MNNLRFFSADESSSSASSNTSESESMGSKQENPLLALELEFSPAWAKQPAKSFENIRGDETTESERPRRPRDDRNRPGGGRPRPPRDPQGQRPNRPPQKTFQRPEGQQQRGGIPSGQPQRREESRGRTEQRGGEQRGRGPGHRPGYGQGQRPPRPVLLPVEVTFLPEEKGFNSMLQVMRQSGRAYSLFEVASLILSKPERHHVKITQKASPEGVRPPFYQFADGTGMFMNLEESWRAVFRHKFNEVFKEEKKQVDAPKGNFIFINRCGITGEVFGPPNYHSYQSIIIKHHQQRLSHMPFERFKARIETVRNEEAVKAWLDSVSNKTEFTCLLDPEPKSFIDRAEAEAYVRQNHQDKLISAVHEIVLTGEAARNIENRALQNTIKVIWENEKRFPLRFANELRPRLQKEGFAFFKVRKEITCISSIKPKRLDPSQKFAEGIQKIVDYLLASEEVTRKQLVEHFAATPGQPAATPAAEAPATDAGANQAPEGTPATPPPAAHVAIDQAEADRVLADLHWLIHQGHVVEFSDGHLMIMKPAAPPPPSKKKGIEEKAEQLEGQISGMASGSEIHVEDVGVEGINVAQDVGPNNENQDAGTEESVSQNESQLDPETFNKEALPEGQP